MRHKDLMQEFRSATKEILKSVEVVVEKYNVHPEDCHQIRSKVKSKIFRLSNVMHIFFATIVDAKFHKKINKAGEIEETHLSG